MLTAGSPPRIARAQESNKEVGDELRQFQTAQKTFRKSQVEKFLVDQHRKVEDSHHQMASATAAVESIRLKNLETGQEMRLNLLELKQAMQFEKQVWTQKGRELVESAKHVQAAKVLERQLSHRGKRQAMGAKTKSERQQLEGEREARLAEEERAKRDAAGRIRQETQPDAIGKSRELVSAEKVAVGQRMRQQEAEAVAKRAAARQAFLASMQANKQEVDAIKSGAKSARASLASYRRAQADEQRQAKAAEKERRKREAEAARLRNKAMHDIMYGAKFAPRERATKVSLPGRVFKTAFNAFDAEAAAMDHHTAAGGAPAGANGADPNGGLGGGMGGGSGPGSPNPMGSPMGGGMSPGSGGRRGSVLGSGRGGGGGDEWAED